MIEKFYFNIIMLMFGGALGATARFTLSQFIDKHFTTQFPVGIFIVNIIVIVVARSCLLRHDRKTTRIQP